MKLTRLKLTNVRCYEHLDISFKDANEEGDEYIRNKTVILGNNGTGKTTVLKAIALVLSGSTALGELLGKPDNWIRNGADSCEIFVWLETSNNEQREASLVIHRGDDFRMVMKRNDQSLQVLDSALEYTNRNYLIIGYGVHRRVIGADGINYKTTKYSSKRAENVATLFDPDAVLYPFESWIMDMDYTHGTAAVKTIKNAINKLIPTAKFKKIDKKLKAVMFENKDGVIPFSQMSDGFKITANWLGDLLYRITQTYEDYTAPLDAKFILVIDELALHLHPNWQRVILQSIAGLFKNCQIITTTHSPFVAQQAGENELFTIMRDEDNKLELFQYENDPRKLLIHQIIMSDIFGLATDESVLVEKAKNDLRKESGVTEESLITNDPMLKNVKEGKLSDLKGVEGLEDLPKSVYASDAFDYKTVVNNLKSEIKRMQDDNANENT